MISSPTFGIGPRHLQRMRALSHLHLKIARGPTASFCDAGAGKYLVLLAVAKGRRPRRVTQKLCTLHAAPRRTTASDGRCRVRVDLRQKTKIQLSVVALRFFEQSTGSSLRTSRRLDPTSLLTSLLSALGIGAQRSKKS